jgi:hypothetical protein
MALTVTCVTHTLDGVYMYARTYEEAYDHHLLPARYIDSVHHCPAAPAPYQPAGRTLGSRWYSHGEVPELLPLQLTASRHDGRMTVSNTIINHLHNGSCGDGEWRSEALGSFATANTQQAAEEYPLVFQR